MTSSSAPVQVYDNTGGPSPDEPVKMWWLSPLLWPLGPYAWSGDGALKYGKDDPRTKLAERLEMQGPDGWVLVKREEILALLNMRICRSTHDFTDSQGAATMHCVLASGHTGYHSNGYMSWKPVLVELPIPTAA